MGREGLIGSTWATAVMRVHETGDLTVITGCQPHGQGQVTTFSQIAAQELGVPVDKIEMLHSSTQGVPYAQGSYGSRSFSVEGAAVYEASQLIKQKACKQGAHMLKVDEAEVEYHDGRVQVKGDPTRAKTLSEIASGLWFAWDLAPGIEPGLEVTSYFDPPDFNFPFGSHAAMVEIDEETGAVEIVRYCCVDDVGNVGNPKIVEGQMHGNVVFGIGPALMEQVIYDEQGHLLTFDFETYPIARPSDMPEFQMERTVTPTHVNRMGAKGAGDVSNPAVAPALINAICDALSDLGVRYIDNPVTTEKIWRAMQGSLA
jgi:carbon-monoxide dehydrogenase large subunit